MNDEPVSLRGQYDDLLRRAERQAGLLQAANQVGQKIGSIRNLDELLSRTVDILCEVYGFCYAGIFLLDESGRWAELGADRSRASAATPGEQRRLAVGGDSLVSAAITARAARIAPDPAVSALYSEDPHLPGSRSAMALPLVAGDQVLGAVTVHSTQEQGFGQDDAHPLQTMANYLAMAIHNARLLAEREQIHAELLRTKTFEAIATTTGEALHWVGNKAAPIPGSAHRVREALGQWLAVFNALLAAPPETRPQHPLWPVVESSLHTAAERHIELGALAGELAAHEAQQLSDLVGLESILEDLDIIEQAADTILSIKEDLIGPLRVQHMTAISLPDLLRRTIAGMGLPDGVVRTDFDVDLPPVYADPRQIQRVFVNLIKNAWEALRGHPHPEILIRTQRVADPGYILVQVHDNGPGIPLEFLDKIWVSFFTTKGDRGGTGLGLSACMEIVTQTGGKIWLDSSQPGLGTTFAVLLPAAQA